MKVVNIICIGDSLTEGYVTKETKRYYPYSTSLQKWLNKNSIHKYKIHNIGVSGATTSKILRHVKQQSLDENKYDIAIILAGTNDLLHKTSAQIMENIKKIHHVCLHAGIPNIIALSLPQIHFERPVREAKRIVLNSKLRTWCNTMYNIQYIPFGEMFMYNARSNIWAHNGYHLSVSGYKKMGEYIAKKIKANYK